MALQFDLAGDQIDGARDYQEDAFLITHLTDANGNPSALVIVADGMGGHAAGNVASNMAVQAFNKHVSSHYPGKEPAKILHECVVKANDSIQATTEETPALSGMGCTMVAAILEGDKLWWASVGDSHVYLIRNKELIKKNADHSYGGFLDRMAAAGKPVQPEPGLARNMLMSALTGAEINEVDVSEEPLELQADDRILLCSDGMDSISTSNIIQHTESSDSPKECSKALLDAVEKAAKPKQDNTTAVVVNITERADITGLDDISLRLATDTTWGAPTETPASKPAPQSRFRDDAPGEGKSKVGLISGILVVLLIAAGGGFFMLQQGKLKPPAITRSTPNAAPPADVEEATDKTDAADKAEAARPAADTAKATKPDKRKAATTTSKRTAAKGSKAANAPGSEFQDTLKDGSKGPMMVWIPAGTFQMGSPGSSPHAEERPRHEVKVKPFALSKYEITFAEYDKYAKARGLRPPKSANMKRDKYPVIFVRWDDAYNYAQWLSQQTGHTYRLPSEAEWEYAAGTGKRSPHWWGYNIEPNRAHCQFGCESRFDPNRPTQIGSFPANRFGIHDTAGNVTEWVEDCWHPNYQGAPTNGKVWAGGDCVYRVVRGGSYSSPEDSIRHSKRDKFKSNQRYNDVGIRLVRELE